LAQNTACYSDIDRYLDGERNVYMQSRLAFVTGATGLLGSNLVRALRARDWQVRALVRSRTKADRQLDGTGAEIVLGDLTDLPGFSSQLLGVDVLFHTAAHFRESYQGGDHRTRLEDTNVAGTKRLLAAAYDAGVRRFVHSSSIAVLDGPAGSLIDEHMRRHPDRADDYQRSKILSEAAVREFLRTHPDMWAAFVLPGWMHGPGDLGPTSAGQLVRDFLAGKLPGIVPATFSVVDARDVAEVMIAAEAKGDCGDSYVAAGRHMTLAEVIDRLEHLSGVSAPKRVIPLGLLFVLATVQELYARLTKRPALLSLAAARLMAREREHTRFDSTKVEEKLGIRFRPIDETLADEIAYFRSAGSALRA
jgi:nucleoside-diphosphate-sugar epimerase